MKFVLAPDSFKECMTAQQAASAMVKGLRRIFPAAEIVAIPMADGGEGTVSALTTITQGKIIEHATVDPLGRPITACFGLSADGHTAFVEVAEASGLNRLQHHERDPLRASSYGTGLQILAALDHDITSLVIGLGGSATNDGGYGIAAALGALFYSSSGEEIRLSSSEDLLKIDRIDLSHCDPRLTNIKIVLASDVTNPLTGTRGATRVFGPQKGITPEMLDHLDSALNHYGCCLESASGKTIIDYPGSGAAGGIGATLLALTGAQLQSGIELVMKYADFTHAVIDADYVFTGEGAIDQQTLYGKTPYGIAVATHQANPDIPVIAVAGKVGNDIEELYQHGFTAIFSINPRAQTLEEALKNGPDNLTQTIENIARLLIQRHSYHSI